MAKNFTMAKNFSMAKNMGPTRGFTLIELIITIAVAAIILALALPDFSSSIRSNRMVTKMNELHASLSIARSAAVTRNNNVTVCRSSTGTSCAGNWEDGRIVFVDNDFDGNVDTGEEILRVYGPVEGDATLSFSQTRVIYRSDGTARSGSNGTFTLCDTRGAEYAKGLVISQTGRPRLAMDSDDNGILEDGDSTDLVCSS